MKRIGLIAAVGFLLVLSELSPSASATQPTSRPVRLLTDEEIGLPEHCPAETATQPTSRPLTDEEVGLPKWKAETFLLVEVKGTIGKDFTAAKMKAALAEARTAKATAIVLSMDTPGGSVTEAEAIVNLIIENKDLRFIALVHRALSAGAAITLACKEIYVMETATIGAAVSYIPDRHGVPIDLPADVAEKFQSAWRAVCRKAADHGGHSSLLAEGMVDPGFAITMRTEGGKVILERDGKGKLIKARGRILTLTAKEAVVCELAKAVVPDVAGLGARLGMPKWIELGSDEAEVKDDRPTLRLPDFELKKLFDQYRLLLQNATATKAAVAAKEHEIRKKLIGRNVEWTGILQDVQPRGKGFVIAICYRGTMVSWTAYRKNVFRAPLEIIDISMMSANNRWVSAKKGSSVAVTGRIRDIGHIRSSQLTDEARPRFVFLRLSMAMDELGPEEVLRRLRVTRERKYPVSAPVNPEAEARKRLGLADTYKRNGMTAQALKILRSVIKEFPNTAAAKKAEEQLKELESKSKKAGKAS